MGYKKKRMVNKMKYTSRGQGSSFDGGDLIKKKLEERYMTQRDLAEAVGLHPAKLSEIIRGFRRPSKKELEDIKDALGIDLNDWRKNSKYVSAVFPLAGNTF